MTGLSCLLWLGVLKNSLPCTWFANLSLLCLMWHPLLGLIYSFFLGRTMLCVWAFELFYQKIKKNKRKRKTARAWFDTSTKDRVRQNSFLDLQTSAVAKLQKGPPLTGTNFRWCHAHRTTCWAQKWAFAMPWQTSKWAKKKKKKKKRKKKGEKGKIDKRSGPRQFFFSKWTIPSLFSRGSGAATRGSSWLFCKINNSEKIDFWDYWLHALPCG